MTGQARTFVYGGLRVRSELDLALPVAEGPGWDVDVHWGPDLEDLSTASPGEAIAAFEAPNGYWYSTTQAPDGYHVRVSDCGEFVISTDLSEVVVRRGDDQHTDLLPIIMAGTVVTIVLMLRGETVLHASAVSVDGRALAFVGQSGRGKSTVAALMCLSGFELVTDDLLVVRPGPPAMCVGGATELRLRAAASDIARDRPSVDTRTTADDRVAFAPARALDLELPLAAIVIPSPDRIADEVLVDVLSPSDALIALLSIPRLYGWKRSLEISRDFAVLSRLLNDVPAYHARVPWGPPFDPSIGPALARLATRDSPPRGVNRPTV